MSLRSRRLVNLALELNGCSAKTARGSNEHQFSVETSPARSLAASDISYFERDGFLLDLRADPAEASLPVLKSSLQCAPKHGLVCYTPSLVSTVSTVSTVSRNGVNKCKRTLQLSGTTPECGEKSGFNTALLPKSGNYEIPAKRQLLFQNQISSKVLHPPVANRNQTDRKQPQNNKGEGAVNKSCEENVNKPLLGNTQVVSKIQISNGNADRKQPLTSKVIRAGRAGSKTSVKEIAKKQQIIGTQVSRAIKLPTSNGILVCTEDQTSSLTMTGLPAHTSGACDITTSECDFGEEDVPGESETANSYPALTIENNFIELAVPEVQSSVDVVATDDGCNVFQNVSNSFDEESADVMILDIPSEDLSEEAEGAQGIIIVPAPNQLPLVADGDNQPAALGEQAPTKDQRKRQNQDQPLSVGRKRTNTPSTWLKNQTKAARHAGEAFTNSSGKSVSAKAMKIPCRAKCRLRCSERISEEQRQVIFNNFYRTKNSGEKWKFIRLYVESKVPQRPKLKNNPVRRSRKYYFPVNGEKVEVCQCMFLNTLVISDFMVGTALTRNMVSPEKRGGKRKQVMIPDYVNLSIEDHIASFPRVASHYCRANTSYEYLEPTVKSIANMYRLYQDWIKVNNYGPKIASRRQYEDIFNSKHKINFFQPRKDRCDECVEYELSGATVSEERKQAHEHHILRKDLAHTLAKEDKAKYEKGKVENIALCHFDLQKVHLFPHTNASNAYYKRKLTAYNFTIFDLSAGQGYCYVWDETIGYKGATEIASFVYYYIIQAAAGGKKTIINWSDNCGNQNKNRFLFAMYLLLSAQLGVKIVHKYLIKGHTQNEADSMHARIESSCKNETMFVPEEWYKIMESAKLTGKPYVVRRISRCDILNFHPLTEELLKWPTNCRWNEVTEVMVDYNASPWHINVKYDLGDIEYTSISLKSKVPGRPVNLKTYTPKVAYADCLGVTKAKKKDLMSLCAEGVVAQKHIAFYENIKELSTGHKKKDDFYNDYDEDNVLL